jgi:hypothetical protein
MPRRVWVTGVHGEFDLVEVPAPDEHDLQDVVKRNPQLIPAEDLGLDGDLLVVGRETSLASGSVDLLFLARSGDLVIVEFKTGPQNPDFRHALAQVIDYGSDLWNLKTVQDFDKGVVQRYLTGPHVDAALRGCQTLEQAVRTMPWGLGDSGWGELVSRLGQVLATGDFHFVVAAQRFTTAMAVSVDYLNATMRVGSFFLVQVVRLEGSGQTAYSAQVMATTARSTSSSSSHGAAAGANESDFLAAITDPDYQEAISDLLSGARSLGLVLQWYSKGASIRLRTPDRHEPLSVGWVFLEGAQWYRARHVTLGADEASLTQTPSVAQAVREYRRRVQSLPGALPVGGKLDAYLFLPNDFPGVKNQVLQTLEKLVTQVAGT